MCPLCTRVKNLTKNIDPAFIHEFEDSYLVLGDHQYYQGYCVLILKKHIGDLTELSFIEQERFFKEGMKAAKLLKNYFKPYKMNYAVLGNEVEHVHLHLIPRYQDELKKAEEKHPWYYSHKFKEHLLNKNDMESRVDEIKRYFKENL